MSRFPKTILFRLMPLSVVLVTGCAYFNTFYNAQGYYREGLKLKDANQNTQAKAKFEKAIEKSALVLKRWPRSRWADDALFLIGMSYYHEGSFSKAVRQFDQMGLAFPRSGLVPEAELYHGLSMLADKQYGPARVRLDEVKARHRRLADAAAFALARSFLDRDELQQAVDSLVRFYERYPKSKYRRPAVKHLADACLELRRYAEAEQWYERYARLTSDPKERVLARLKAASCRYELGRYAEAIQQARDLVGRYGDLDDEANLVLGKSQDKAGRPGEAIATWARVRGASDVGAEACFRIGKYYEENGRFDTARAYYDSSRLRRVDSDYGVLAVKRLALLDAFTQQKSGRRTPAEAAFLLAEVHNLNLGDYDKAMELYQQVYDSFPTTDWAAKGLFTRAWLQRNVKHDTAGAEPALRKVIAEFPETDYADASRAWLGLPVPKREKKPVPKADTVRADTAPPAGTTPEPPGVKTRVPPSPPGIDTLASGLPGEPGPFPHRPGWPDRDRMRERVDEATGTTQLTPMEDGSRPQASGVKPDAESLKPTPEGPKPQAPGPKPETLAAAPPEARGRVLVYFGTDSAHIKNADLDSLRGFVEYLKANLNVQVELAGFCDPRGTDAYNEALGMRRARAVRQYLVDSGIAETRVKVTSMGEQDLRSTRPEEYWLDRRVESRPR